MAQLKSKPALMIIDMQNGFCNPSGTFGKLNVDTSYHRAIVPAIEHLRQTAKECSIPIIFTRVCFALDYTDSGIILEAMPVIKDLKGFVRGSWDASIIDELAPQADDIVIDKTRNTAFWRTDLQKVLKERGVNQLILTGVGTNVCVESTVHDAFTNDWPVVVVEDATATLTPEEHEASLKSMRWFGQVAKASEVEKALLQSQYLPPHTSD